MPDGRGGYRRPNNPAPVSGPGAMSRRTDGGAATQPEMIASGNGYGERKAMEEIQGGAAMQGGGGAPTPAPSAIPFDAPTQNPGEPVTAGAALGPGIGPEAAGIKDDEQVTLDMMRPLLKSFELAANLPGSNPQTRSYYRKLRARLSE